MLIQHQNPKYIKKDSNLFFNVSKSVEIITSSKTSLSIHYFSESASRDPLS